MAVAIVSTKRKFHQILDSLTNVSSTSLDASGGAKRVATSSSPTWNEPPTKKARVAPRNSTQVAPSSRTNAQPPTTPQLPHTAFLAKTADDMAELPNFAPSNRRQFIVRLETFKDVTKWSEKPERVNEVQWAKRGWTCVDKERVGCVGGCEKQVVIKLARTRVETGDEGSAQVQEMQQQQQEWEDEIDEHLVDEYVKIIETGHHENCLWRRRGCNELIYRLPLVFAQSSLAAFRLRYDSLAAIPGLPITFPPNFEGPHAVMPPPRDFNTPPLHVINAQALVLALFGWQADPDSPYPQATCISCFRRLGLWLYEPKEVRTINEHGNVAITYEPPVLSTLNVAEEHRTYCPWVNAVSQCGESPRHGAQAGWEVLIRVAKNAQLSRREQVTSQPALPPTTSEDVSSPTADVSVEGAVAVGGGGAVEAAGGDGGSKPGSKEARDAKDKERVTKLRKLARMFRGRKGKKKDGGAGGEGAGGAGAVASG